MIDRRKCIGAIAAGPLAFSRIGDGQARDRVPVVGVLVTEAVGNISLPILIQGLRDLVTSTARTS